MTVEHATGRINTARQIGETSLVDRRADFHAVVNTFSIGFLAIDRTGNGLPSRSAGSGTLVDFLGIRGVLTAAHVARAIQTMPEVGLMRFRPGRSFDALTCRGDEFEVTAVGAPPWSEAGPDLAFVRLPPKIEAAIAQESGFFNSLIRARQQAEGITRSPAQFDFVTGVVSELSRFAGRIGGSTQVEHAVMNVVGHIHDVQIDGHGIDRIAFRPFHNDSAPAPESYEGLSGGGLWQLGEENDLRGRTLVGVVYYQSAKDERGNRMLRCHGPMAVHEVLYLAVLDRYLPEAAKVHRETPWPE